MEPRWWVRGPDIKFFSFSMFRRATPHSENKGGRRARLSNAHTRAPTVLRVKHLQKVHDTY
jgi:hypothetical protein